MENFYLMDLINAVNGSFVIGNPHLPIREISIDTRTIKEGSLFFAIKGKTLDGHDFIRDAIEKGEYGAFKKQMLDSMQEFDGAEQKGKYNIAHNWRKG